MIHQNDASVGNAREWAGHTEQKKEKVRWLAPPKRQTPGPKTNKEEGWGILPEGGSTTGDRILFLVLEPSIPSLYTIYL